MFKKSIIKRILACLPDKYYLQVLYFYHNKRWINYAKPTTFNEKLQWLKLNDRNPLYSICVDKYRVKEYVSEKIGQKYIIPTIGVWDSVDDINFDELPNQFVLKTTHGGGGNGVVICKDKKSLNIKDLKEKLRKALLFDQYKEYREWPYKNVPHRIIAEEFIEDKNDSGDLPDYKFFCFNGEPRYCQVIRDRSTKETIDFYDMDWKHMSFIGLNTKCKNGITPVKRPMNLENMKRACRVLANDIPFARIDLYEVNGKEYFGEITFYPAGGFGTFAPSEWNSKLGDLLSLEGVSGG